MKRPTIKSLFLMVMVFIIILLVVFFLWIVYGTPIHDFRLWILERQFTHTDIHHPIESISLGRKSYLGGPSTHGDRVCIYAVGEARSTSLGENDIRQAYQNITVAGLPLKVFFADGNDWPYELPFVIWQEELWGMSPTENTVYMVYIASKYHFLGDLRCDD